MEHIERIDRTLRYQGTILKVYEDSVRMPDGKVASWDFLRAKGGAGIVAVRNDGKILMVRQFRNAIDRFSLEIPAGARDYPEEPAVDVAFRELSEETGYTTKKELMRPLIKLVTAVAFCDETTDVFVADSLTPGKQHLDEEEFLDVEAHDLDELVDLIYRGEIQDSKTVAAILAYKNQLSDNN